MTYFIDLADKRNTYVKENLENTNQKVDVIQNYGNAKPGDVLIYAPSKKFTLDEIKNFNNDLILVCGNINEEAKTILKEKNIKHINLMQDEIFAIKNSTLTAEGILCLILQFYELSIFDSKILILGAGRIGKATALLFEKLNINFSFGVFTKKSFNDTQYFSGKHYFNNQIFDNISNYDIVINTIPAQTIDEKYYKNIKNNCLFLEIASIQTMEAEKIKNFTYMLCPALPQKFCAKSAGKVMFDSIIKISQKN